MLIGLGLGLTQARRAAAAAGGGLFTHGFNFRITAGLVTDGANESYVLESGGTPTGYPTTRDGVTFGWEDTPSGLDRSAAVDRRLAGINYLDNSTVGKARFRVDVPAGTYDVRLAIGDQGAGEGLHTVEILDGVTSRFTVSGASTAAAHFLDANGTDFALAAWPGSNVARSITMSGTTFRMRIGQGNGTGGTFTTIAHLFLTQTA